MVDKKKRKVNGVRIADELIEVAPKEIIEDNIEDLVDNLTENIEDLGYTCDRCGDSNQCPYAYDPYCVLGDCLMEK